ncbi:MAG: NADH-quinone oxidoreductase subunit L [Myxococcota bacterium]|nr:NADH-quinone oxidoreductase subunit L [Myxococcota bacterium]
MQFTLQHLGGNEYSFNLLYLIPLFPLLGAAINGLLWPLLNRITLVFAERKLPRGLVHVTAVGAMAASAGAAIIAFLKLRGLPLSDSPVFVFHWWDWFQAGGLKVAVAFRYDQLTAVMCLIITCIGAMIHVYSIGYMSEEESYNRYFTYLNLFVFFMLILVMGDSLPLMFVGWEGVGLASYLLIGFWFEDSEKASAGKKAFIVNRVGDAGYLLGMFMLFVLFGTLNFSELADKAAASGFSPADHPWMLSAALICLFIGAAGKSAQIPLYVWLPDAMAGPTPVSALIHAATMVTAGVYMIARLNFVYALSPAAMTVVAGVGAATALFAATMGFYQNDIKKVLAYSTVSQLGFMFIAVGVGAWWVGIFHLMTHAFFKACLFLGAGSVIHGMHHEQDMRKMGGLKSYMPITYWTYFLATLAIAGIPPFSGFFSKDEILYKAWTGGNILNPAGKVIFFTGLLAALCTAFYMFRSVFMTFHGESRADEHTREQIHESPRTMTAVLAILAFLATSGGFLGLPHWIPGHPANVLEHWLEPVFAQSAGSLVFHEANGFLFAVISVAVALSGILLARYFYLTPAGQQKAEAWRQDFNSIYTLVQNKYYVDEFYDFAIVKTIHAFSVLLWRIADAFLIDTVAVNGLAQITYYAGYAFRALQTGNVQRYAVGMIAGLAVLAAVLAAKGG